MTQSVELLLDAAADAEIRAQWDLLADAGLPTERRPGPGASHAPHLTLWAGDEVAPEDDEVLPGLFAGLDLELVIDGTLLFGPRRNGYVLVRPVAVSRALLALQQRVVQRLGPGYGGFHDGGWSPHVTLARRVGTDAVGPALRALADAPVALATRVRAARRWDSDRKVTWPLPSP